MIHRLRRLAQIKKAGRTHERTRGPRPRIRLMAKDYFGAMAEMRDPQTYRIIGAAMAVHREFGRGFLEAVYQESMELELGDQQIPFARQVQLVIQYKGRPLQATYRADLVCFGEIIVEIKALAQITGVERAQVINYLKATGFRRALILNFGADSLQFERVVLGAPNSHQGG